MTTATAETTEPAIDPIMAFKMPDVTLGKEILWFRFGEKGKQAEVAFVIKKGERNLRIRTAGGIVIDAVRHVDDPKLKLSEEQRTSGAWDFTDDCKATNLRIGQLESKLAALTAQVAEILAPAPESKKK